MCAVEVYPFWVSEIDQFRDEFDAKVQIKLDPLAANLTAEIQALRDDLTWTRTALENAVAQLQQLPTVRR